MDLGAVVMGLVMAVGRRARKELVVEVGMTARIGLRFTYALAISVVLGHPCSGLVVAATITVIWANVGAVTAERDRSMEEMMDRYGKQVSLSLEAIGNSCQPVPIMTIYTTTGLLEP